MWPSFFRYLVIVPVNCLGPFLGSSAGCVYTVAMTGCSQHVWFGQAAALSSRRSAFRPSTPLRAMGLPFLRLRRADHFHKFTLSEGPTTGSLPGLQEYKKRARKIPSKRTQNPDDRPFMST